MAVLLDTSVVIDCLRLQSRASAYFRSLSSQPFISVVTIAEVQAGVRTRREEEDAARFWAVVNPLRIDLEISQRAGTFVSQYHASHTVELADALIAATAEHHGLEVATLNVEHFPMFKRLKAPY